MSLQVSDHLSMDPNLLENALLQYPGLEDNLDKQQEVAKALEIKLHELLEMLNLDSICSYGGYLNRYVYHVLEVAPQQQCTPVPKGACTALEEVPEHLCGIKSLVNMETEQSVVYPDVEAIKCYPVGALQKFDEPGKELGSDAQVWKTYIKEADPVDKELVDRYNKPMDIILIFVRRYSRPFLQHLSYIVDYAYNDYSPSMQTLPTVSQTHMFITNGSQPTSFPSTSEMGAPPFKALAQTICVKILWFLSLSFSVAVWLIAMLAKEWCLEFMTSRTGPPGAQAFLFVIGLCVFLWEVHFGVAIPVLVVTASAASGYFSCTILPFLYDYCPYGTVPSRLFRPFTAIRLKSTRDVATQDDVTARALHWMIVNCKTPRSVDIALQSLAVADEKLPPAMREECGAWSLIKWRSEMGDVHEKSEPNYAASLYKRALEVYPPMRKSVDLLDYGQRDVAQIIERFVLSIQTTLNSLIHEQLSHAGLEDERTLMLLKRCTLIGRHFLAKAYHTKELGLDEYQSYIYILPGIPKGSQKTLGNSLSSTLSKKLNWTQTYIPPSPLA
ncbi:hypothetical protein B0J17DRAFT_722946 [Rhizoctonia solani]|nr:hypothetical protein B0J17DRAFT_722946 [Rhizoctonia solani]